MDGADQNLYFSIMPVSSRVPAYFLYGEPLRAPDERTVHVETIAARSQLHDWHIRAHRHLDLHQVVLIERGRAVVETDNATHRLRSPALVCVPPGVVHSFAFDRASNGVVISFAASLTGEFARRAPAVGALLERALVQPLRRQAVASADIASLTRLLMAEFEQSSTGRDAVMQGLLMAILVRLVRATENSAEPPNDSATRERDLVRRLRAAIELRFREHRSVADYARELRVSEIRLRRACRTVLGRPPAELVQERVLIEAQRQLRYTSMTVAEVAYYLGFDDPAYFSRFFARGTGRSPRAFKAGSVASR
jgi:AraC family transcriptional regulator, transcriptional activator of pobA